MEESPPAAKKAEETAETKPFFTPPTYTMKEIHDAIPAHCFERNTLLSLCYVLQDLTFVAILMGLATQIPLLPTHSLRVVAWAVYSFCQGLIFTGLWELAHECGHGALSKYKWANNSMGLIVHSLLLVPYHSWRFTHSQHHKATNNIERDIAFVPDTKDVWIAARAARSPKAFFTYWDLVEDMPIVNLLILVGHQLIAWPIYLAINNFALPRMRAVVWWKRSHFYFGGDGPNFKPSNRDDIILSDFGVGLVAAALWASVNYFGAEKVFLLYGAPWLWTNHWILTITFLQHTDSMLPYYPSRTWSFLRGAGSTVDRDFGFIGHNIFHGAVECHVLHHHAPRIPFYHAEEASNAIKSVMGEHYRSDVKTPFLWAFWKNYTSCRFVEEKDAGSGIYFFGKK
ncbi:Fatty acid desaturase domain containing protein [Elaphomyces granulatus]